MCSFVATSLYVAVIICVNIVVYAVCKCVRRFNPSPIYIKRVGFAKVLGVFCEFVVRGVQIDFTKGRGVFLPNLRPQIVHASVARKFVCGSHHTCQCCGICSV